MKMPSVISAVQLNGNYTPHRPALIVVEPDGARQFSAGDLAIGMNAWAQGLAALRPARAKPGEKVAVIVAPRGFGAYAAFLGAMRAGMAACFLPGPSAKQDPQTYWESHRAVLARIAPAVVVAPAALAGTLRTVVPAGTPLVDSATPPPPGDASLPPIDDVADDSIPAILQHSSGTTGLKKGVVLTHEQIGAQVAAYAAALGMTREDRVASWLPLYHDMGLVTAVLLPLCLGALVVAMDPFDWLLRPSSILAEAARYRASFCWLPNFAFAHLVNTSADEGPFDLSQVRSFVDCSEPCRAATLDSFVAAFRSHGVTPGALSTCYAMAETVFAVTQSPIGRPPLMLWVDGAALAESSRAIPVAPNTLGAIRLVSCGPPIAGTEIRIAPIAKAGGHGLRSVVSGLLARQRPNGADAAPVGEILVKSPSAFAGYHQDPEASKAALVDGWYKTGDLGFLHNGELYVTGRIKDLIIVNGRNVYAHDIEAAANAAKGVKPGRSAAFGVDCPKTGTEAVVVVVESTAEPGPAVDAVARCVRDSVLQALGLALHDVIVKPPGVLVKTTSGKVSRDGNRLKYAQGVMA